MTRSGAAIKDEERSRETERDFEKPILTCMYTYSFMCIHIYADVRINTHTYIYEGCVCIHTHVYMSMWGVYAYTRIYIHLCW